MVSYIYCVIPMEKTKPFPKYRSSFLYCFIINKIIFLISTKWYNKFPEKVDKFLVSNFDRYYRRSLMSSQKAVSLQQNFLKLPINFLFKFLWIDCFWTTLHDLGLGLSARARTPKLFCYNKKKKRVRNATKVAWKYSFIQEFRIWSTDSNIESKSSNNAFI